MLIEIDTRELFKLYEYQEKYKELRKTSRKFLKAISGVPMRAADCDQGEVDCLWEKLAEQSGYNG